MAQRLKNGIPEEIYYRLLEWKDANHDDWEEFRLFTERKRKGKNPVLSLNCLSVSELRALHLLLYNWDIPID